MADSIVIVELLVDSAQAVTGAQAVVPALEEVAIAAQAAAAAVDKLGVSLDSVGVAGGKIGASAAAAEVGVLSTALTGSGAAAASATRDITAAKDALVGQAAATAATTISQAEYQAALQRLGGGRQTIEAVVAEHERLLPVTVAATAAAQQHGAAQAAANIQLQQTTTSTLQHAIAQTAANVPLQQATASTLQHAAAQAAATVPLQQATAAVQQHGAAHTAANVPLQQATAGTIQHAAAQTAATGPVHAATAAVQQQAAAQAGAATTLAQAMAAVQAHSAAVRQYGATLASAGVPAQQATTSAQQYGAALIASNPPLQQAIAAIHQHAAAQAATVAPATLLQRILQGMGVDLSQISHQATGSASKLREFAVLLREIGRGDMTRFIGSLSIELRNFGLLGLVFNPWIDAIALFTAGLIAATVRASTLQQELRTFKTDITFFQPSGANTQAFTPQYLQGLTQQLIDTGAVGRADAVSLVQKSLQSGVSTDLLPQIAQVSQALEKLYGGDATAWSEKFIHALNGGYESLRKFGIETHTIDASTVDDLHDLAQGGDKLALQQAAVAAAVQSTAGIVKSATGDAKTASESLSVAWDHVLNAMANTVPIQKAHDVIDEMLKAITALAEGKWDITVTLHALLPADWPEWLKTPDSLGKLIDSGTGGGLLNHQLTPNAVAAQQDLNTALAERWGTTSGAVASALQGTGTLTTGGALAPGSTANITSIVATTLDVLASASSSQLGNVTSAIRSASAVGGYSVGGASSDTFANDNQKITLDANTDAIKTLTTTLNQSADKVSVGRLTAGGAVSSALSASVAGSTGAESDLLAQIRQRENSGLYTGKNPGSSASGAYQIIDATWARWSAGAGFGGQFPNAQSAPAAVQDAVALYGLRTEGTTPWNASAPAGGYRASPFASLPAVPDFAGLLGGTGFSPSAAIGANEAAIAQQKSGIGFDITGALPKAALDAIQGITSDESFKAFTDAANKQSVTGTGAVDQKSIDGLKQLTNQLDAATGGIGKEGAAAQIADTATRAYTQAVNEGYTGWTLYARVQVAVKDTTDKLSASNDVAAAQNARQVVGINNVATAYGKSAVEAEMASAAVEAQNKHISTNVSVGQAEIQVLALRTAQALQYGAQRINAAQQQLQADQRLANASHEGIAALKEQEIANKAIADTLDVRTKAQALVDVANKSGTEADKQAAATAKERANQEQSLAQEIEHRIAVEQQIKAVENQITGVQDQNSILQLQTSLTLAGATSGQIQKQVDIKRVQLEIDKQVAGTDDLQNARQKDSNDLLLTEIARQGDLQIALEKAKNAQNGFNEAIKKAADAIDTTLTTAITNAFDGQKAVDWGQTLRKVIAQIIADIANIEFIRPLTGTILGALGLSGAAKGFGNFNDLLSGGGGGIDPVSGLSNATTSGTSTSLLGSLGQIGSAVGGLSKLGSLFSGGGLGSLLGASTDVGATIAGTGGLTAQALLDAAPTAAAGAGLVSETALSAGGISSALSGAGSALGGIGSVLGSVIPYVGPLVGVVSLIGGLFGNKKPSLASSGDVLDLTSNSISGFSSSGNAQNDAAVRQISTSLQSFVKSIQQQTGGTVPTGDLNVVATTKGIETHYSGALGKIDAKFADAQSAISGLELAITQNLTGVSDTLKAVLANVTDPSQIQAAVTFATTYDNLKKAADSAFSSISTDTFQLGPFATALANLQKTFGDLTTQANQFGLSLDPINAGLAEATKRLQTDFGTSLDQALNTANANDFVNQLQAVSKTFGVNSQEAQALGLGGDAGTQAKIAQIEATQAAAILAPLTADQLQTVITKLGQTNPEISSMAQAILSAGLAATGATASLTNLATGIKAVEDLANSLRGGQLSGLPPAQAAAAAGGTYQASLSAALAAGKNVTSDQLSAVATSGAAAIQASQAAFGQGPQTAALRAQILGGLGQVTAITGPSSAIQTTATPASVAQGAISASSTVQAAQVTAVIAALHAAGVPGYALGTRSSLPGAILVGESGPEIITQPGGLSITPISAHPGWSWQGGSASNSGSSSGVAAMLSELQALRGEVMALRKQTQGGQVADGTAMQTQNTILANIDRKAGPGVVQPTRQRMGR